MQSRVYNLFRYYLLWVRIRKDFTSGSLHDEIKKKLMLKILNEIRKKQGCLYNCRCRIQKCKNVEGVSLKGTPSVTL